VIPDLGRTGGSVAVFPTTAPSLDAIDTLDAKSPRLDYDFYSFHHGPCKILVTALPTQRIHEGRHLRYAVALDGARPAALNLEDAGTWEVNVLRAAAIQSFQTVLASPGKHTLKIWMMDPGVVLDKIVVDLGGLRPSYLGPPETAVAAGARLDR
jgi:hypothetical protein